MHRLLASFAVALWAGIGAQAQEGAQQSPLGAQDTAPVAGVILTLDLDRMFEDSLFGQRAMATYNSEGATLATENRRIAEALREEELALAARRANMDPDVFRAEAEAFDVKAQEIRRAQDSKRAAVEQAFATARTQFFEVTRPILERMMLERGAVVVLDRRTALLSLRRNEITDDAIARINEVLGDGSVPPSASEESQPDDGNAEGEPAEDPQPDTEN